MPPPCRARGRARGLARAEQARRLTRGPQLDLGAAGLHDGGDDLAAGKVGRRGHAWCQGQTARKVCSSVGASSIVHWATPRQPAARRRPPHLEQPQPHQPQQQRVALLRLQVLGEAAQLLRGGKGQASMRVFCVWGGVVSAQRHAAPRASTLRLQQAPAPIPLDTPPAQKSLSLPAPP